jgi:hypothetical protein
MVTSAPWISRADEGETPTSTDQRRCPRSCTSRLRAVGRLVGATCGRAVLSSRCTDHRCDSRPRSASRIARERVVCESDCPVSDEARSATAMPDSCCGVRGRLSCSTSSERTGAPWRESRAEVGARWHRRCGERSAARRRGQCRRSRSSKLGGESTSRFRETLQETKRVCGIAARPQFLAVGRARRRACRAPRRDPRRSGNCLRGEARRACQGRDQVCPGAASVASETLTRSSASA